MPELFDTPKLFEQEILGKLAAYLNKADPEIEVFIEYPISTGRHSIRADTLLRKGSDSLLIEIKLPQHITRMRQNARRKLMALMSASGILNGILFIPPISDNQEIIVAEQERNFAEGLVGIFIEIYPRSLT